MVGGMTRILLVSGSTREGSLHTAALRTAARFAPADVTPTVYGGLRALPAFVPGDQPWSEPVAALRHEVGAADAILFSTPEYAGSLPGTLKNLLDWLVDGGELDGKPAAWLSVVAPGKDEGALATLQTALEHGGARVLRSACIRIPLRLDTVDAHGIVDDPRLHLALQDMLRAFTWSLAVGQEARGQPSWQAYSSVYPVVLRPDGSAFPQGRS
jgi:NAD(P)H-dependent FMN reductase